MCIVLSFCASLIEDMLTLPHTHTHTPGPDTMSDAYLNLFDGPMLQMSRYCLIYVHVCRGVHTKHIYISIFH